MNHADTVVFDKTGTLTFCEPSIIKIISLDPDFSEKELVCLAAASESKYSHPVALAILKKAKEMNIDVPETREVEYRIGYGVESRLNGKAIFFGSKRFMEKKNIDISSVAAEVAEQNNKGKSVLFIAVNGKLTGWFTYSDTIRPEAVEVIKSLRSNGVKKVALLTGDNRAVAASISRELGIDDFVTEALPEQKLNYVKDMQRKGHTVVAVGDGINDSPALTVADVGITVKGGVGLAKESADIILMEENLHKIVEAFYFSKNAMGLIKQDRNILYAVNTGALATAAFGVLSATGSSAISDGASVLATLNSLKPLILDTKLARKLKRLVSSSAKDDPMDTNVWKTKKSAVNQEGKLKSEEGEGKTNKT